MKWITLGLLLALVAQASIAQTTNYYNRMNHVFGAIDKSKVTTGLLKEFGVRLNEVEAYNGVISAQNWVDKAQWQSLYHSIYSMRIGPAPSMSTPSSVYSFISSQQTSNPNTILLLAEYYTYQQYKTDAYTNGDVTVLNDRIYDVSGRNPDETKVAVNSADVDPGFWDVDPPAKQALKY